MGITTKKGDDGTTSIRNKRLRKDDVTIELLGNFDEVIAFMVLAYNLLKVAEFKSIVDDLSAIAGNIAGYPGGFTDKAIVKLEQRISGYHDFDTFIYPFEDYNKSVVNIARTKVRQLERTYTKYIQTNPADRNVQMYINRLSDYLYTFL